MAILPDRSRARALHSTAVMVLAGAVALSPLVPSPVGATAGAPRVALSPVDIRVGETEGFTRVEFAGVIGARATVRRQADQVIVRVGSTAAPDIARLRVDPPPGVERVETRAVERGTEIVLTLAEGGQARWGRADGAVYLNLYPAGSTAAPAPEERPADTTVAVSAEVEDSRLTLDFAFSAPVPAAVVRRGEAVWIVFQADTTLSMPQPPEGLGPVRDIRWTRGEGFVAVRLSAPGRTAPSARLNGSRWRISVGGAPQPPEAPVTLARDEDSGPTAMVATLAGAGQPVWIEDPATGDRFAVVPALGPTKGLNRERRLVDMVLLASAHGLGLAPRVDDLAVTASGDLVRIARPQGLRLSAPGDAGAPAVLEGLPEPAPYPAVILDSWADTGDGDFSARYRALQDAAAREVEPEGERPIQARLALARFLIGSQLHYEAIGVLNAVVAEDERWLSQPEVRGLRGAARAAVGRLAEARADFAAGPLQTEPSAAAWRGYIAAGLGEWEQARIAFNAGASTLDAFPPTWRARFGVAHAEAAIETGDLPAARALLNYALSQDIGAIDQLKARLVQARLFELEGQSAVALAVYRAVATAPFDGVAAPAEANALRLELASEAITPAEAVSRLAPLRFRWRGDATELRIIRTLGGIYLSQGRYREALEVLRGAGTRLPNLPEAAQLQQDLGNAFRALFLEGAADGLQPIQAVALFEDFRELTPVGADGDEMVRRLAQRLVDVDLLAQAASLLEYQVENRLDGVAKASVATDLAAIHLMNRDAEAALQALWNSRSTLLPTAMAMERRALEARALSMLGRHDHALEILGDDTSDAAQDVRADVFWRLQRWADAARVYEARLGERWRDGATRLSSEDETRLIRAGVGYSLARDTAALARLSSRYRPFIDQARSPEALRVALAGPTETRVAPGELARLTASVDSFTGWVAAMKRRMREDVGATETADAA